MNSISLALMDAGIPLLDTLIATNVGVNQSTNNIYIGRIIRLES